MRTLILSVLILAGCSSGGDGESCLTTHGYEYDQIGVSGLTLRATLPHYSFISFEEMEKEYIDVEACAANTNTPGPDVIFQSFEHIGVGGTAFYTYPSQTVYINIDQHDWAPQRNCLSDRKFLRHEYVHHILFLNGEDSSHENPKFISCNALGPKTCNGQYCE